MTERDRFIDALRAAAGVNDNKSEAESQPPRAIIFNGSVGAVYIGEDLQKKQCVTTNEIPTPSRIPLDRQCFTPRRVIRSILENLPPCMDPAIGSGADLVASYSGLRRR